MNILMVHNGDKSVRSKIRREIIVRDCYYKQIWGDCLDKKRFLMQFDYILLTLDDDSLIASVTQKIKHLEVPEEKILIYKYYENNIHDKSLVEVDRFLHSNDQYEGLIIGMSHTNNGIRTECFDNKLLKLGVPSIDLYYMKRLIEILVAANKLSHFSYIIIELPYYIFNWDISRANKKGYERYSLMYYFNDYHHFTETEESREYMHKMHIMDAMMKEKLLMYCSQHVKEPPIDLENKKADFYYRTILRIIKAFYHCAIRESKEQRFLKQQACERGYWLWQNVYSETINENKKIWQGIVHLLKNETKSAKVFLAVFPHNPYFISCHSYFVRKMRSIFYKAIGKNEDLHIIDHFKYFKRQQFYFLDECHLNDLGAYIYSNHLRRELKRSECQ